MISGEPVGARTRDLLIKSQLLYQLSYRPITGRLFMNPIRGGQVQKQAPLAKSPDQAYIAGHEGRATLRRPAVHEDARCGQ